MTASSSICFVTEGGDEVGYGHLFRTCVLARALKKAGYAVTLCTRSEAARDFVVGRGLAPDIAVVMDIDLNDKTDWQAWDLRDPVPVADVLAAKSAGRHTLLVDELGDARTVADIVVDALLVPERAASLAHSDGTRYLYGLEYYALDERCTAARRLRENSRPTAPLVVFGGSDPAGLVVPVMSALHKAGFRGPVTIVTGQGHPHMDTIRDLGRRMHAEVLEFADDLPERIATASVVVTKLGLTTIEAFAIGTPVVLIEPYPFHEEVSASLANHYPDWPAATFGLGNAESFKAAAEFIVQSRFDTLTSPEPYCDGQGAARIMDHMASVSL